LEFDAPVAPEKGALKENKEATKFIR